MTEILLGIDAGTSAVKVCAYRPDGCLLGRASRNFRMSHPRPGWAEMSAEDVWRDTTLSVREALAGVDGVVTGIGVSSACPTTIVMDDRLCPLRPAILYLDQRGGDVVRDYCARYGGEAHLARAGNRPGCSTSWLATLAWLRDNEPDVWRRTRTVSLLGGFFTSRMTGRTSMDWTQASYSGGFRTADPEAGWDETLLERWGVEPGLLAEVGWSCRTAGVLSAAAAAEMGICPGAAVAFGAADTAAAAFALGVRNGGDVFESAGTSGVITFCLDRPDFDDAFMNRCHIFPGRWLAHGAMSTLGGAFNWLRANVWPDLTGGVEELERLAAASVPGANGLVFLPYLAGERSPIWDPDASGMWLGLRMDSTRNDMIRAVFEGTAFGLRQILDRGRRIWNYDPKKLVAVGGGARSRLWAEIKADVLDVEYLRADEPDAAAWGAAIMGGIAAGTFDGADDPQIYRVAAKRTGEAGSVAAGDYGGLDRRERRVRYASAFAVYETLYPSLGGAMRQLADLVKGNAGPA